ncbi:metal-dependent hydrolase [Mesobacillus subterraneus]|uniref:Metal-dependent hydrolase n=1 Tax=Mesobacillus subterraneus TaxID=285983 RepID=A0A3R9F266_9BACI|nr:metal-dependent hydrolase [Mesobacillus subterraneus]RSD28259.1 metal-dependent hydrolase [Mesobacillus subterraneus]
MDSITHTLFGLALYGAVDKTDMEKNQKRAYLLTAVGASQIPDIDVISQLWDNEGLYQMWHRGITHSIFLTPVWALIFLLLSFLLFKVKDLKLFFLGWVAVAIHNSSDLFNAWGTGYLEPFSSIRITFGTIPIIDFVFWIIFAGAFIVSRKNKAKSPRFFKLAWVFIALHVIVQSVQGWMLYNQYEDDYEQIALSAGFIPWTYTVITKNDSEVAIYQDNLFSDRKLQYEISSAEEADLNGLFEEKPEARTLYEWSPFVVIVDDGERLGVYDPRFYRNGQSFLFEYIDKTQTN